MILCYNTKTEANMSQAKSQHPRRHEDKKQYCSIALVSPVIIIILIKV